MNSERDSMQGKGCGKGRLGCGKEPRSRPSPGTQCAQQPRTLRLVVQEVSFCYWFSFALFCVALSSFETGIAVLLL